MFFGEYLVSKKLLKKEEINYALESQRQTRYPMGKLAVEMGYISKLENIKILLEQKKTKNYYGEIAKSHGLLTEENIKGLMEAQKAKSLPLGKILVEQTSLSRFDLIMALKDFIRLAR